VLLEDLLFLARCDSESVEMPMAPLPLQSMLDELCGEVRPLAESKAIRLKPDLAGDPVRVMGNESALRRLMLVLLDNAIVYSNTGGEVGVRLRRNSHEVCVEVTDSGPGINEADLPHIFDRFYRSRQARDQHQGGYGLGLSLAAGIAQRHRARIEVDSIPEHGSAFRVFFSAIFQE
jgi:signal transduction histidine kinase